MPRYSDGAIALGIRFHCPGMSRGDQPGVLRTILTTMASIHETTLLKPADKVNAWAHSTATEEYRLPRLGPFRISDGFSSPSNCGEPVVSPPVHLSSEIIQIHDEMVR